MAVFPRSDRNPYRNEGICETLGLEPRTQQALAEVARQKRAREGVIDLVEINGVWQVPPSVR